MYFDYLLGAFSTNIKARKSFLFTYSLKVFPEFENKAKNIFCLFGHLVEQSKSYIFNN